MSERETECVGGRLWFVACFERSLPCCGQFLVLGAVDIRQYGKEEKENRGLLRRGSCNC